MSKNLACSCCTAVGFFLHFSKVNESVCVLLQIAHPSFLRWTLPAIEGKQVRLAHTRPAYENVSLHGDVFSQVRPHLPARLGSFYSEATSVC